MPVKHTKKSWQPFDWNRQCLFCGEECPIEVDKKNPEYWRESFECRTSDSGKGKLSFKEVNIDVDINWSQKDFSKAGTLDYQGGV